MRALAIILLSFISCTSFAQTDGYIKGEKGIEYKIISSGSGALLKEGDYAGMYFKSVYQGKTDTLLNSTYETGVPQILKIKLLRSDMPDTSAKAPDAGESEFGGGMPPEYFSVLTQLRSGDSLSLRILSDSIFKDHPESMPPFMESGRYLYTNVKVAVVYTTYAAAAAAKKTSDETAAVIAEQNAKQQVQIDELKLRQYFAAHRISPVKTPKGAYILMKSPGIGLPLDKHCVLKVNYTGKNLAGEVFDSNTDPGKGHTEPLTINLTDDPANGPGMIEGFADGISMMKDKSKATIFIPSGLAYGNQSMGTALRANENLIFEVEVLSVKRIRAKTNFAAPKKRVITKKPIKHT